MALAMGMIIVFVAGAASGHVEKVQHDIAALIAEQARPEEKLVGEIRFGRIAEGEDAALAFRIEPAKLYILSERRATRVAVISTSPRSTLAATSSTKMKMKTASPKFWREPLRHGSQDRHQHAGLRRDACLLASDSTSTARPRIGIAGLSALVWAPALR